MALSMGNKDYNIVKAVGAHGFAYGCSWVFRWVLWVFRWVFMGVDGCSWVFMGVQMGVHGCSVGVQGLV
jgi:hypothetical protein